MKKTTLLLYFSLLLITKLATAQTDDLWGMTPDGGAHNGGVIFKMNISGAGFDTVYSFNPQTGGFAPSGDLLKAANGYLYGTTFSGGPNLFGSIFSFNPSNNTYEDVYYFDTTTGIQSFGSLIQINSGKLYGMAGGSGADNFGVIFSFDPNTNTYTDVHDFDSTHGSFPYGNLLVSGNGKMYGMTQYGGAHNFGVLFSFDTLNNFTDLHDFDSIDGQWAYGSLVQAGGKLFGVTAYGGVNDEGVLFSYDIAGNVFTKLYDFNSNNGGVPEGSLVQATGTSIFYGATSEGGDNGDGVIFSFDTSSNAYTDAFNFTGTNGEVPPSGLLLAGNGNLYGMTFYGGANSNGTIFSFDPSDSDCNDIHDFNGSEGESPNGNLIEINTTGIQQLATLNNQLSIYPNPASNQVTIISKQLPINEIRITNIMGQVVYTFTFPQGQYNTKIDVSTLLAGMYFVSVISNNQTITNKISVISK